MSRIGRVNDGTFPILSGPGGIGGSLPPATVGSVCDITDVDCTYLAAGDVLVWDGYTWTPQPGNVATSMWVPVMTEDTSTGLWYVAVTGDGDAVMTEVPL